MSNVRKDQSKLSPQEWSQLIDAVDQTHGVHAVAPAYRAFVALHVDAMTTAVGMSWEVHTMQGMGMVGHKFLAWHRRYLRSLELRLQLVHPEVRIPYWDWVNAREIPAPLTDPATLQRWSVTRGTFDATLLPTQGLVDEVLKLTPFVAFQGHLEALHNPVHNAVGGDMGTARSPNDPLFFLHHANIDRLWATWEDSPQNSNPPHAADDLQPTGPIISGTVSDVLSVNTLGYSYE